jgi:hypothetical protein
MAGFGEVVVEVGGGWMDGSVMAAVVGRLETAQVQVLGLVGKQ